MKKLLTITKRLFFFRLSSREQLLTVILLFTVLIIWGDRQLKSLKEQSAENTQVKTSLQKQNIWIHDESNIDQRLQDRVQMFDPEKTYSAVKLVSKMDELTAIMNSKPNLSSPDSKKSQNFHVHTLRLSFKSIEMEELIKFYNALKANAPYISLKNFKINANSKNPNLLSVDLLVRSFELSQSLSQ